MKQVKTSFVMVAALALGFAAPSLARAQSEADLPPPPPPPPPAEIAPAPNAPPPGDAAPSPPAEPPPPPPAPPVQEPPPPAAPAPAPSAPPAASFAPVEPAPAAKAPAPAPSPARAPAPAPTPAAAPAWTPAPAPAPTPAPAPSFAAAPVAAEPEPGSANPPPPRPLEGDNGSEEEPSGGDGRIGWLGIGFRVGIQHFNETTVPAQLQSSDPTDPTHYLDLTITARNNTMLQVPIDIGGNGLGIEIAPYFAKGELRTTLAAADVTTYGAFVGFVLRGRFGNLYPHLGLGMQGGYMKSDALETGVDLYGRVPVGLTYYVGEDLAIVVEGGIAYGASGFKGHDIETEYGSGAIQATVSQPDLKFGAAPAFDASIGLRIP